jgi:hypothetical protein
VRQRLVVALLVTLAAAALPAATATAQHTANVQVRIASTATLDHGGQAVFLTITVRCDPVGQVLEAGAFVSQHQASGEGGFTPICDGHARSYQVRVQSFDGPFRPGAARASAFVILENHGQTFQGQDSRNIQIR